MRHERTLLAMVLLLGASLRMSGLAHRPLDADEAAHAWRAARAAGAGEVVADGVTNAFLTSAQAVSFALAGPTTLLARLPAALCGLALLLVPLVAKDALGSARAVGLVILLALDPTLVRVARDGSGASAALLAAGLAVAGLLRWSASGREDARRGRGWAVATGASVGLLLTTGPDAWGLAPLVGLVALALRPWTTCPPRWRDCAAAFAVSSLLGATAGLWAMPWAAAVSASLTAWLERWTRPSAGVGLRELPGSAPLTIVLALAAFARAARAAPRRAAALLLALAWGTLFALRSPGPPVVLAIVLAWAAAEGVSILFRQGTRLRVLLAAAALALAVQLAFAARPMMPDLSVPARPDLERLAADLERIAVLKRREAHELPVLVLGERIDPSLRWALRHARDVRYEPTRPTGASGARSVLVLPSADPGSAVPTGYVGTTYASAAGDVSLWVPRD